MQIPRLLILLLFLCNFSTPQPDCNTWYEETQHGSIFRNVKAFGAKGDGKTDDTKALQAAIDHNRGNYQAKAPAIVYLPPGAYLISETLVLWYYTHFMGNFKCRPSIILTSNSPGFNDPTNLKPVIATCNGWNVSTESHAWWLQPPYDTTANNNFYVQIHNIDILVSEKNSGASGIWWAVAQQTSIRNVTLRSVDAYVGIDVTGGNDYPVFRGVWPNPGGGGTIENVDIEGFEIGVRGTGSQFFFRSIHISGARQIGVKIWREVWDFVFLDLVVERSPIGLFQSDGFNAIVLQSRFSEVPVAIQTTSPIYIDGITADRVGWIVRSPFGDLVGDENKIVTVDAWFAGTVYLDRKRLANKSGFLPKTRDIPLPLIARPTFGPIVCNAFDYGAKGDGKTDDTLSLQKVINACEQVFLPYGQYAVSDTLFLKSNTKIVGEGLTIIYLSANSTRFEDPNNPRPVISTPDDPNGSIWISDVQITTGIGNLGAIFLDWRVGGKTNGLWDTHFPTFHTTWNLVRFSGSGAGLLSNVWGWSGDHNLTTLEPIGGPHSAAIGFLGESAGPVYLYGTAFEHHSQNLYLFRGARNYTIAMMQTEQAGWLDYPVPALVVENSQDIQIYGTLSGNWRHVFPYLAKVDGNKDVNVFGLGINNVNFALTGDLVLPGGPGWNYFIAAVGLD